jgi:hypothetical protein
MNLGYYECISGNAEAGFSYMRHALKQYEMLSAGTIHPELAAVDTQIAMMLTQTRTDIPLAIEFQSRAVKVYETIFTKEHEQTIRAYDLLCRNYIYVGDFKKALEVQRVIYKFLKSKVGEDNKESEELKEAEETLKALTQRAVMDAKKGANGGAAAASLAGLASSLKTGAAGNALPPTAALNGGAGGAANAAKMAAKRANLAKKSGNANAASPDALATSSTSKANGSSDASNISSKGHLPIDELMSFIENGGSGKKLKKKASKATVA